MTFRGQNPFMNLGGFQFDMNEQMSSEQLVRIIPTRYDVDLAFCTYELLQYNQEWTPLGHQRWLREREECNVGKV